MSRHARIVTAVAFASWFMAQLPADARAQAATTRGDLAVLFEPAELAAIDRPNDAGEAVMVTWRKMPFEGPDVSYELLMSDQREGPFWPQGRLASAACPLMSDFPSSFGYAGRNRDYHAVQILRFTQPDPGDPAKLKTTLLHPGQGYFFKLAVIRGAETSVGPGVVAARPVSNWFAWQKMNVFVAMIFLSFTILYSVRRAKRNPSSIFVRRIAGLEAVDDALGRAAEMGKPVYFCHGLASVDSVVTISSVNILGKIAERVAEFGTEMKVTCFDYLVMQVSQEMVKAACVRVGRPDAYKEDSIFFISDSQFAYATAVEGMLLREKPATCFYFGQFQAESLLLSETGAVTKAIQIAGTDTWSQIPFFITTCDYTLIGEELYAASAYLSRDPRMLGTVKGQDLVKAVLIAVIIAGAVLAPLGVQWFARLFSALN